MVNTYHYGIPIIIFLFLVIFGTSGFWTLNASLSKEASKSTVEIFALIAAAFFLFSIYLIIRSWSKKRAYSYLIEQDRLDLERLKKKLRTVTGEREWLLKEIHHRVKNNLQIVISMLNTQSVYLENDEALLAIRSSQHRMHAMSLIHHKMYHCESLSSIDIQQYIVQLVAYLQESFRKAARVDFKLHVGDIRLDISQAVPLGLIINESLTNAIKHAFLEKTDGIVSITLEATSEHQYLLIISDNGSGLPKNFNFSKHSTLGLNLIRGLSKQLDGEFSIHNSKGCTIQVAFERSEILEEESLILENL